MRKLMISITVLFLIVFLSSDIFAQASGKGDWGFNTRFYKYALIEGKITAIDYDKKVLEVKGTDTQLFFCEHTTFYLGDISLPMENVFWPPKLKEDQKINAVDVKVGDFIKSRYNKDSNDKIYLDICLVGNNRNDLHSREEKGSDTYMVGK